MIRWITSALLLSAITVTLLQGQSRAFVDVTVMPERQTAGDVIPFAAEVGYMHHLRWGVSAGLSLGHFHTSFDGPGGSRGVLGAGDESRLFITRGTVDIFSVTFRLEQKVGRLSLAGFIGPGRVVHDDIVGYFRYKNTIAEPDILYAEDLPVSADYNWHRTWGVTLAYDVYEAGPWVFSISAKVANHLHLELDEFNILREPQQYQEWIDIEAFSGSGRGWTTNQYYAIGLQASYLLQ